MKPHFPRKQAGMGAAGWMLVIVVFGSVLTVGLKLVPPFLDHNTMSKVLDAIAAEAGMAGQRDDAIRRMITKRFKINNIRDFKVHEDLDIMRSREGVKIVMDYEIRMNLFRNVDLVASFDKSVELRN